MLCLQYTINDKWYTTKYGSQESSLLECTNVSKSSNYGSREALDVSWRFKCSLYSEDGTFFKEIEEAELSVSVFYPNN